MNSCCVAQFYVLIELVRYKQSNECKSPPPLIYTHGPSSLPSLEI